MDAHTLALVAAAKLILDAIIFAIPDKWLAAHTTEQVVVNLLRRLLRPGVAVALALALLLAMPARADEPPALAPIRAPVVAPVVPPEAITPQCPPPATPVKPAPAWASYLGWGLAAATEILTLSVTLYQRAP